MNGLLVHRANRIAAFYQAWPDRNEAARGIAEHLSRQWAPELRAALAQAAAEGAALEPLVLEALRIGRRLP